MFPVEASLQHFALDLGKIEQVRANKVTHLLINVFTTLEGGFAQLSQLEEFQKIGVISVAHEFDAKICSIFFG